MFTHDDIKALARDRFGTEPDHPFADDDFTYTLRQPDHGKWYAVGMRGTREVIGLPGDGLVDIVNVKADPNIVPSLTKKLGILPGYHMNKAHWITVVMKSAVTIEDFESLLSESFALTAPKKPHGACTSL